MENFIGLTFFLLLAAGIGFVVVGARQSRSPSPGSPYTPAGVFICGLAFLWIAALNAYFEGTSPRLSITGTIGALRRNSYKNSSSDFTVIGDNEQRAAIHCTYDGTGLQMGERIRVQYIQYNHHLLEAEVLSGSVAGWHFAEPDSRRPNLWLGSLGLAALLAAYLQSKKIAS